MARWLASLLALVLASCGDEVGAPVRLRLATTTSTENSGLLAVLLPPFEKEHNVKVDVIAVGTGKALKLAENGDVDVVLVHAREAEDKFVSAGFGVGRRDVMHNDFVIVGPSADPAKIAGLRDAAKAFQAIAAARAPFVSRGDESGTHQKEKAIWKAAAVQPAAPWHREVGQGMGGTLTVASEKQAYTLADRGTWAAYRRKVELALLGEGDRLLANPYGIIAVNPQRHKHARYAEAMKLIEFVTSPEGRQLIAGFRVEGEQVFYPDAAKP
ncbi:MAG: tungsten ABC transporter substrate-binding protein [Planctomycetes bacterium]|nr:tungsten ABC transporter substrate-binding protein [Planctomycetota bacterium]